MREEDVEVAIKVVVVGNGAVGKSSMIQRYCKGIFTKDYKKTIGVDFLERQIRLVLGSLSARSVYNELSWARSIDQDTLNQKTRPLGDLAINIIRFAILPCICKQCLRSKTIAVCAYVGLCILNIFLIDLVVYLLQYTKRRRSTDAVGYGRAGRIRRHNQSLLSR